MSKKKVKILVCLGCVTVGVLIGSSLKEILKSFENDKARSSSFHLLINSLTAIKEKIIINLGYKHSKVFVIREHADFLSTWPEFEADIKEVAVIGFDCEWTTSKNGRNPVALMQIATYNGLTLLIQLNQVKALPNSLLNCLKDENIIKVGVGCLDDAKKLSEDRDIVVNGCFDLRFLVDQHSLETGQKLSLKALTRKYLEKEVDKPKDVQCSNWDCHTLSSQQIKYAADDAIVAVQIFVAAMTDRFVARPNVIVKQMESTIKRDMWQQMHGECLKFRDIKFKDLRQSHRSKSKIGCVSSNGSSSTRSVKSSKSRSSLESKYGRKRQSYDNCKLQAPNGDMLSTCDRKKAEWYVKKGLAAVVSETPFTVQLNFEPAGKPQSKDDFQLNERSNCCVVCGYNGHVANKNIIPRDYKKFFPEEYKSHNPHDVVPLCIPCHQQSNMIDHDFKVKISQEFSVPLDDGGKMMSETKEKLKIHRAANALKYNRDKIPHERKQQLVDTILNYYKENVLDQRILDKACSISESKEREKQVFVSHAEQVVNILKKDNVSQNIYDFQKLWREHFVDSMQPRYMPANWKVDYKHMATPRHETRTRRKLKLRSMSPRLKVVTETVSSSDLSAVSQQAPLKSSLKNKSCMKRNSRSNGDNEPLKLPSASQVNNKGAIENGASKKGVKASENGSTSFSVFNEMRAFLSRDFNFGLNAESERRVRHPSVNEPDRTSNSEEVLNTRLLLDEDGVRKFDRKNKSNRVKDGDVARSSPVDPVLKKTKSDGNLVVKKITNPNKKRGVNFEGNLQEDLHCDPEPQIEAKNVCFRADSVNETADNNVQVGGEVVVQDDKEKGELLLTEKKGENTELHVNENSSFASSSLVGDLASCVEDDSVMLVLSPEESQDNLKADNLTVENINSEVKFCEHRENEVVRSSSASSSSSIPNEDTFEVDQVVKSIDSENVLQGIKKTSNLKQEISQNCGSNQRSIFSDTDENILSCEDQKSSKSDEFYSLAAFESTENIVGNLTFSKNENSFNKNTKKKSIIHNKNCNEVSSFENSSEPSEFNELFCENDKQKYSNTLKDTNDSSLPLKTSVLNERIDQKNSEFSSITTTSKSSDASYSMRKIPTKLSGKISKRKLSSSSTTGLQYAVNSLNSHHSENDAAESSPINAELFSYVPNIFKPSSAADAIDREESALDEEPQLPYVSTTDSNSEGEESAQKKLSVSSYTEISLSCAGSSTLDEISTDPSDS